MMQHLFTTTMLGSQFKSDYLAIEIFGDYAMLVGQLLSLVGIVALLIQVARWISKRHVSRDFTYFIITVLVIASMQVFSVFRFDAASNQLADIEHQNNLLLGKEQSQLNLTLTNQGLIKHTLSEARADEQKAILDLNLTRFNSEVLHQLLIDIHSHLSNATLNASQLKAFDIDVDRK